MKARTWILPLLLFALLAIGLAWRPARADGPARAWEYKHVLIPLDRNLTTYERTDRKVLAPVQRLGQEGWELVSAYEPPGGFTINRRASVEFWFKRAIR